MGPTEQARVTLTFSCTCRHVSNTLVARIHTLLIVYISHNYHTNLPVSQKLPIKYSLEMKNY